MSIIFPRALEIAAKTFADRPKIVGEILVALVTDSRKTKLSEVQKYILAECFDEINIKSAQRVKAAEAKRRQRAK